MVAITNDKHQTLRDIPYEPKQYEIVVNGYMITLNSPDKPDDSAISDIKRMILGGVVNP